MKAFVALGATPFLIMSLWLSIGKHRQQTEVRVPRKPAQKDLAEKLSPEELKKRSYGKRATKSQ